LAGSLDVLVVSDLHYVGAADHVCLIPRRRSDLGPELLRRAYQCLLDEIGRIDLAILLGDLVDDGEAPGADADLAEIAGIARGWEIPVLAVPGNHDGEYGRFAEVLRCAPGLHEVGGYGFLVYHDAVGEGHVTARPQGGFDLLARVAAERPDLPLVALQHNPLHPPIESDYPFLLTNAKDVLAAYREAGVALSLSGHYHPGQAVHLANGVNCCTVPALCEAPFYFAHVRLDGRAVTVRERALGKEDCDE
jgi:predicted MPP superfamily phosphohydrolase